MAMRTGILGGTFDPVHKGHIAIAEAARDEYQLDRVLVMPSGVSYLKAGTNVTPAADRGAMTELAIRGVPGLVYDDREIRRPGNSYTCDTISELRAEFPEDELFYIVGADTILSIHRWKDIQVIFDGCTLLAAMRGEAAADPKVLEEKERLSREYDARIELLSCPRIDISSTFLREAVRKGGDIREYVTEAVADYIRAKGLYC